MTDVAIDLLNKEKVFLTLRFNSQHQLEIFVDKILIHSSSVSPHAGISSDGVLDLGCIFFLSTPEDTLDARFSVNNPKNKCFQGEIYSLVLYHEYLEDSAIYDIINILNEENGKGLISPSECEVLPSPAHGGIRLVSEVNMKGEKAGEGSLAMFYCDLGYTWQNGFASSTRCNRLGNWTGYESLEIPGCIKLEEEKQCLLLPLVSGHIKRTPSDSNNIVPCNNISSNIIDKLATLQKDSKCHFPHFLFSFSAWSIMESQLNYGFTLDQEAVLMNADTGCADVMIGGGSVIYECLDGYQLEGFSKSTCDGNTGEMIPSVPKCSPQCVIPTHILDGSLNGLSVKKAKSQYVNVNKSISFSCPPGYSLSAPTTSTDSTSSSPGTIKCQLDEVSLAPQWSADISSFTCVASTCGEPATPNEVINAPTINSKVSWNPKSFDVYSTIFASCPSDKDLYGDEYLTCDPSGKWKGVVPYCGPKCADNNDVLGLLSSSCGDLLDSLLVAKDSGDLCSMTVNEAIVTLAYPQDFSSQFSKEVLSSPIKTFCLVSCKVCEPRKKKFSFDEELEEETIWKGRNSASAAATVATTTSFCKDLYPSVCEYVAKMTPEGSSMCPDPIYEVSKTLQQDFTSTLSLPIEQLTRYVWQLCPMMCQSCDKVCMNNSSTDNICQLVMIKQDKDQVSHLCDQKTSIFKLAKVYPDYLSYTTNLSEPELYEPAAFHCLNSCGYCKERDLTAFNSVYTLVSSPALCSNEEDATALCDRIAAAPQSVKALACHPETTVGDALTNPSLDISDVKNVLKESLHTRLVSDVCEKGCEYCICQDDVRIQEVCDAIAKDATIRSKVCSGLIFAQLSDYLKVTFISSVDSSTQKEGLVLDEIFYLSEVSNHCRKTCDKCNQNTNSDLKYSEILALANSKSSQCKDEPAAFTLCSRLIDTTDDARQKICADTNMTLDKLEKTKGWTLKDLFISPTLRNTLVSQLCPFTCTSCTASKEIVASLQRYIPPVCEDNPQAKGFCQQVSTLQDTTSKSLICTSDDMTVLKAMSNPLYAGVKWNELLIDATDTAITSQKVSQLCPLSCGVCALPPLLPNHFPCTNLKEFVAICEFVNSIAPIGAKYSYCRSRMGSFSSLLPLSYPGINVKANLEVFDDTIKKYGTYYISQVCQRSCESCALRTYEEIFASELEQVTDAKIAESAMVTGEMVCEDNDSYATACINLRGSVSRSELKRLCDLGVTAGFQEREYLLRDVGAVDALEKTLTIGSLCPVTCEKCDRGDGVYSLFVRSQKELDARKSACKDNAVLASVCESVRKGEMRETSCALDLADYVSAVGLDIDVETGENYAVYPLFSLCPGTCSTCPLGSEGKELSRRQEREMMEESVRKRDLESNLNKISSKKRVARLKEIKEFLTAARQGTTARAEDSTLQESDKEWGNKCENHDGLSDLCGFVSQELENNSYFTCEKFTLAQILNRFQKVAGLQDDLSQGKKKQIFSLSNVYLHHLCPKACDSCNADWSNVKMLYGEDVTKLLIQQKTEEEDISSKDESVEKKDTTATVPSLASQKEALVYVGYSAKSATLLPGETLSFANGLYIIEASKTECTLLLKKRQKGGDSELTTLFEMILGEKIRDPKTAGTPCRLQITPHGLLTLTDMNGFAIWTSTLSSEVSLLNSYISLSLALYSATADILAKENIIVNDTSGYRVLQLVLTQYDTYNKKYILWKSDEMILALSANQDHSTVIDQELGNTGIYESGLYLDTQMYQFNLEMESIVTSDIAKQLVKNFPLLVPAHTKAWKDFNEKSVLASEDGIFFLRVHENRFFLTTKKESFRTVIATKENQVDDEIILWEMERDDKNKRYSNAATSHSSYGVIMEEWLWGENKFLDKMSTGEDGNENGAKDSPFYLSMMLDGNVALVHGNRDINDVVLWISYLSPLGDNGTKASFAVNHRENGTVGLCIVESTTKTILWESLAAADSTQVFDLAKNKTDEKVVTLVDSAGEAGTSYVPDEGNGTLGVVIFHNSLSIEIGNEESNKMLDVFTETYPLVGFEPFYNNPVNSAVFPLPLTISNEDLHLSFVLQFNDTSNTLSMSIDTTVLWSTTYDELTMQGDGYWIRKPVLTSTSAHDYELRITENGFLVLAEKQSTFPLWVNLLSSSANDASKTLPKQIALVVAILDTGYAVPSLVELGRLGGGKEKVDAGIIMWHGSSPFSPSVNGNPSISAVDTFPVFDTILEKFIYSNDNILLKEVTSLSLRHRIKRRNTVEEKKSISYQVDQYPVVVGELYYTFSSLGDLEIRSTADTSANYLFTTGFFTLNDKDNTTPTASGQLQNEIREQSISKNTPESSRFPPCKEIQLILSLERMALLTNDPLFSLVYLYDGNVAAVHTATDTPIWVTSNTPLGATGDQVQFGILISADKTAKLALYDSKNNMAYWETSPFSVSDTAMGAGFYSIDKRLNIIDLHRSGHWSAIPRVISKEGYIDATPFCNFLPTLSEATRNLLCSGDITIFDVAEVLTIETSNLFEQEKFSMLCPSYCRLALEEEDTKVERLEANPALNIVNSLNEGVFVTKDFSEYDDKNENRKIINLPAKFSLSDEDDSSVWRDLSEVDCEFFLSSPSAISSFYKPSKHYSMWVLDDYATYIVPKASLSSASINIKPYLKELQDISIGSYYDDTKTTSSSIKILPLAHIRNVQSDSKTRTLFQFGYNEPSNSSSSKGTILLSNLDEYSEIEKLDNYVLIAVDSSLKGSLPADFLFLEATKIYAYRKNDSTTESDTALNSVSNLLRLSSIKVYSKVSGDVIGDWYSLTEVTFVNTTGEKYLLQVHPADGALMISDEKRRILWNSIFHASHLHTSLSDTEKEVLSNGNSSYALFNERRGYYSVKALPSGITVLKITYEDIFSPLLTSMKEKVLPSRADTLSVPCQLSIIKDADTAKVSLGLIIRKSQKDIPYIVDVSSNIRSFTTVILASSRIKSQASLSTGTEKTAMESSIALNNFVSLSKPLDIPSPSLRLSVNGSGNFTISQFGEEENRLLWSSFTDLLGVSRIVSSKKVTSSVANVGIMRDGRLGVSVGGTVVWASASKSEKPFSQLLTDEGAEIIVRVGLRIWRQVEKDVTLNASIVGLDKNGDVYWRLGLFKIPVGDALEAMKKSQNRAVQRVIKEKEKDNKKPTDEEDEEECYNKMGSYCRKIATRNTFCSYKLQPAVASATSLANYNDACGLACSACSGINKRNYKKIYFASPILQTIQYSTPISSALLSSERNIKWLSTNLPLVFGVEALDFFSSKKKSNNDEQSEEKNILLDIVNTKKDNGLLLTTNENLLGVKIESLSGVMIRVNNSGIMEIVGLDNQIYWSMVDQESLSRFIKRTSLVSAPAAQPSLGIAAKPTEVLTDSSPEPLTQAVLADPKLQEGLIEKILNENLVSGVFLDNQLIIEYLKSTKNAMYEALLLEDGRLAIVESLSKKAVWVSEMYQNSNSIQGEDVYLAIQVRTGRVSLALSLIDKTVIWSAKECDRYPSLAVPSAVYLINSVKVQVDRYRSLSFVMATSITGLSEDNSTVVNATAQEMNIVPVYESVLLESYFDYYTQNQIKKSFILSVAKNKQLSLNDEQTNFEVWDSSSIGIYWSLQGLQSAEGVSNMVSGIAMLPDGNIAIVAKGRAVWTSSSNASDVPLQFFILFDTLKIRFNAVLSSLSVGPQTAGPLDSTTRTEGASSSDIASFDTKKPKDIGSLLLSFEDTVFWKEDTDAIEALVRSANRKAAIALEEAIETKGDYVMPNSSIDLWKRDILQATGFSNDNVASSPVVLDSTDGSKNVAIQWSAVGCEPCIGISLEDAVGKISCTSRIGQGITPSHLCCPNCISHSGRLSSRTLRVRISIANAIEVTDEYGRVVWYVSVNDGYWLSTGEKCDADSLQLAIFGDGAIAVTCVSTTTNQERQYIWISSIAPIKRSGTQDGREYVLVEDSNSTVVLAIVETNGMVSLGTLLMPQGEILFMGVPQIDPYAAADSRTKISTSTVIKTTYSSPLKWNRLLSSKDVPQPLQGMGIVISVKMVDNKCDMILVDEKTNTRLLSFVENPSTRPTPLSKPAFQEKLLTCELALSNDGRLALLGTLEGKENAFVYHHSVIHHKDHPLTHFQDIVSVLSFTAVDNNGEQGVAVDGSCQVTFIDKKTSVTKKMSSYTFSKGPNTKFLTRTFTLGKEIPNSKTMLTDKSRIEKVLFDNRLALKLRKGTPILELSFVDPKEENLNVVWSSDMFDSGWVDRSWKVEKGVKETNKKVKYEMHQFIDGNLAVVRVLPNKSFDVVWTTFVSDPSRPYEGSSYDKTLSTRKEIYSTQLGVFTYQGYIKLVLLRQQEILWSSSTVVCSFCVGISVLLPSNSPTAALAQHFIRDLTPYLILRGRSQTDIGSKFSIRLRDDGVVEVTRNAAVVYTSLFSSNVRDGPFELVLFRRDSALCVRNRLLAVIHCLGSYEKTLGVNVQGYLGVKEIGNDSAVLLMQSLTGDVLWETNQAERYAVYKFREFFWGSQDITKQLSLISLSGSTVLLSPKKTQLGLEPKVPYSDLSLSPLSYANIYFEFISSSSPILVLRDARTGRIVWSNNHEGYWSFTSYSEGDSYYLHLTGSGSLCIAKINGASRDIIWCNTLTPFMLNVGSDTFLGIDIGVDGSISPALCSGRGVTLWSGKRSEAFLIKSSGNGCVAINATGTPLALNKVSKREILSPTQKQKQKVSLRRLTAKLLSDYQLVFNSRDLSIRTTSDKVLWSSTSHSFLQNSTDNSKGSQCELFTLYFTASGALNLICERTLETHWSSDLGFLPPSNITLYLALTAQSGISQVRLALVGSDNTIYWESAMIALQYPSEHNIQKVQIIGKSPVALAHLKEIAATKDSTTSKRVIQFSGHVTNIVNSVASSIQSDDPLIKGFALEDERLYLEINMFGLRITLENAVIWHYLFDSMDSSTYSGFSTVLKLHNTGDIEVFAEGTETDSGRAVKKVIFSSSLSLPEETVVCIGLSINEYTQAPSLALISPGSLQVYWKLGSDVSFYDPQLEKNIYLSNKCTRVQRNRLSKIGAREYETSSLIFDQELIAFEDTVGHLLVYDNTNTVLWGNHLDLSSGVILAEESYEKPNKRFVLWQLMSGEVCVVQQGKNGEKDQAQWCTLVNQSQYNVNCKLSLIKQKDGLYYLAIIDTSVTHRAKFIWISQTIDVLSKSASNIDSFATLPETAPVVLGASVTSKSGGFTLALGFDGASLQLKKKDEECVLYHLSLPPLKTIHSNRVIIMGTENLMVKDNIDSFVIAAGRVTGSTPSTTPGDTEKEEIGLAVLKVDGRLPFYYLALSSESGVKWISPPLSCETLSMSSLWRTDNILGIVNTTRYNIVGDMRKYSATSQSLPTLSDNQFIFSVSSNCLLQIVDVINGNALKWTSKLPLEKKQALENTECVLVQLENGIVGTAYYKAAPSDLSETTSDTNEKDESSGDEEDGWIITNSNDKSTYELIWWTDIDQMEYDARITLGMEVYKDESVLPVLIMEKDDETTVLWRGEENKALNSLLTVSSSENNIETLKTVLSVVTPSPPITFSEESIIMKANDLIPLLEIATLLHLSSLGELTLRDINTGTVLWSSDLEKGNVINLKYRQLHYVDYLVGHLSDGNIGIVGVRVDGEREMVWCSSTHPLTLETSLRLSLVFERTSAGGVYASLVETKGRVLWASRVMGNHSIRPALADIPFLALSYDTMKKGLIREIVLPLTLSVDSLEWKGSTQGDLLLYSISDKEVVWCSRSPSYALNSTSQEKLSSCKNLQVSKDTIQVLFSPFAGLKLQVKTGNAFITTWSSYDGDLNIYRSLLQSHPKDIGLATKSCSDGTVSLVILNMNSEKVLWPLQRQRCTSEKLNVLEESLQDWKDYGNDEASILLRSDTIDIKNSNYILQPSSLGTLTIFDTSSGKIVWDSNALHIAYQSKLNEAILKKDEDISQTKNAITHFGFKSSFLAVKEDGDKTRLLRSDGISVTYGPDEIQFNFANGSIAKSSKMKGENGELLANAFTIRDMKGDIILSGTKDVSGLYQVKELPTGDIAVIASDTHEVVILQQSSLRIDYYQSAYPITPVILDGILNKYTLSKDGNEDSSSKQNEKVLSGEDWNCLTHILFPDDYESNSDVHTFGTECRTSKIRLSSIPASPDSSLTTTYGTDRNLEYEIILHDDGTLMVSNKSSKETSWVLAYSPLLYLTQVSLVDSLHIGVVNGGDGDIFLSLSLSNGALWNGDLGMKKDISDLIIESRDRGEGWQMNSVSSPDFLLRITSTGSLALFNQKDNAILWSLDSSPCGLFLSTLNSPPLTMELLSSGDLALFSLATSPNKAVWATGASLLPNGLSVSLGVEEWKTNNTSYLRLIIQDDNSLQPLWTGSVVSNVTSPSERTFSPLWTRVVRAGPIAALSTTALPIKKCPFPNLDRNQYRLLTLPESILIRCQKGLEPASSFLNPRLYEETLPCRGGATSLPSLQCQKPQESICPHPSFSLDFQYAPQIDSLKDINSMYSSTTKSVVIACSPGYSSPSGSISSVVIECSNNVWSSPSSLTCDRDCMPLTLDNRFKIISSLPEKSSWIVKCADGYSSSSRDVDSDTLHCEQGKWVGETGLKCVGQGRLVVSSSITSFQQSLVKVIRPALAKLQVVSVSIPSKAVYSLLSKDGGVSIFTGTDYAVEREQWYGGENFSSFAPEVLIKKESGETQYLSMGCLTSPGTSSLTPYSCFDGAISVLIIAQNMLTRSQERKTIMEKSNKKAETSISNNGRILPMQLQKSMSTIEKILAGEKASSRDELIQLIRQEIDWLSEDVIGLYIAHELLITKDEKGKVSSVENLAAPVFGSKEYILPSLIQDAEDRRPTFMKTRNGTVMRHFAFDGANDFFFTKDKISGLYSEAKGVTISMALADDSQTLTSKVLISQPTKCNVGLSIGINLLDADQALLQNQC